MARKGGFIRRDGRMRRQNLWLNVAPSNTTLASASTATITNTLNAAALSLRPFTVVRSRGFWHVTSDQNAAIENWGCSLGMCVVSDQAVAIGVTAVPTPSTDLGSDLFFLHETVYGRLVADSTAGRMSEVGSGQTYDSKAMRKVDDGQDLVVVIETPAIIGSAVVLLMGRILIKLH